MSVIVSIVMPVYNAEKYLRYTLDSVKAQTFKQYELIAINDGSTDNSLKILQDYQRNMKQLRIVDQENTGVSTARNNGIKAVEGEYLCFLDADDYLHPDYLGNLYEIMDKEKVDIVCCDYQVFYTKECEFSGDENTFNDSHTENIYDTYGKVSFDYMMSIGLGTALWNKMYRKSLLLDNGIQFFPESSYGEDMFFNWKAVLVSRSVFLIKRKLYGYRLSETGASVKYHPELFEHYEREYKQLIQFGKIHNFDISVLKKSVQINLAHRISSFLRMNIRRNVNWIEKYKYLKYLREKESIDQALQTWNEYDKEKTNKKERKMLELLKNKKYMYVFINSIYSEKKMQLARKIKTHHNR